MRGSAQGRGWAVGLAGVLGAGTGRQGCLLQGPALPASRQMGLSSRRTGVGLPRHLGNTLRVSYPRLHPGLVPLETAGPSSLHPRATGSHGNDLGCSITLLPAPPWLLQALMSRAASCCSCGQRDAGQPQPAPRCCWAEAGAAVVVGSGTTLTSSFLLSGSPADCRQHRRG